ncbi:hypothetical protein A2673_03700 [Candidatus Kaiserbacteria bacterium RIFCSPHIGHO2_01_FULL_50_13]|uniref:Glycosyltransferase RgtA/B/C/D-like domain-containing protein n=1 Tax=Candidatus Kaiserbacteria bacterium RIFCSPLOWO2_01_FULL_50_24 TaxID=1798507 RepID=A0A1F6EIU1_9BACT|nr:MAG: hypothetical protein A2673_03700 [Candidatus Kaiserbacteria bacterium RIFCSPHIGHO2_01_FULL_50_13]OGG73566.1 MAG: hypothetical protein A3A34_02720 [Candidatus Kaiserbacteria bacterium RIFCSPLOWO2_01_FULL_50_24]OGG82189.1 MAG: hypothetical protein A3H74_03340 [Candidatus Kaiserbacteria bacterium RIFCSPLOWO2_02_FULL_51_13]
MALLLREHWAALALALIAAAITIAPHLMLWSEPGYRGIEMMTLDAENHYMARIHEVYEGHPAITNTFLENKDLPYATPPLGEIVIAGFGKFFGLDAARAAIASKPLSVFIITLLIYALAFSLSRSRVAALIAAAFPTLGYNLIALSLAPVLDLIGSSPSGGPFLIFSRLVNPSISDIFLFGALVLMYRNLFEREAARWWQVILLGALIGGSLYMSPYVYSFLGALLLIAWVWFLAQRDGTHARAAFFVGIIALVCSAPFVLNYAALHAHPDYETFSRFIGLAESRHLVLGFLLPLMAMLVAFMWPRDFPKKGRMFLLFACVAVFLALNQQLITGVSLHTGHYHWYITKPLAGIIAGLFIGGCIVRFVPVYFKHSVVAFVLGILIYNSMGFLAPWYAETHREAVETQAYGPLVEYLGTRDVQEIVWSDVPTADFIPIYTAHSAPNSINLGSYPIPQSFLDNRFFLEYRLRGVAPKDFEGTIRSEAAHVSARLWGLWLRETKGDETAIPEEEFSRIAADYAVFHKKSWSENFDALDITLVAARTADRAPYDAIPALKETATVGDFVIYKRL